MSAFRFLITDVQSSLYSFHRYFYTGSKWLCKFRAFIQKTKHASPSKSWIFLAALVMMMETNAMSILRKPRAQSWTHWLPGSAAVTRQPQEPPRGMGFSLLLGQHKMDTGDKVLDTGQFAYWSVGLSSKDFIAIYAWISIWSVHATHSFLAACCVADCWEFHQHFKHCHCCSSTMVWTTFLKKTPTPTTRWINHPPMSKLLREHWLIPPQNC